MMLVASMLSACLGSSYVEPATVPPSLKVPCADPVSLPDRGLNDAEIELLWGRDRSALRVCGSKHEVLADAVP
jgi:hypothetical protein